LAYGRIRKAASDIADHRDPIQEFADQIVAALESWVKPWVRPWDPEKCGGPHAPFNPTTGQRLSRHQCPDLGNLPVGIPDGRSALVYLSAGARKEVAGQEGRKSDDDGKTDVARTSEEEQNSL
jgi:hypothetical protein